MQLTEGTAMSTTESRFVLDDVADVLQLLVTKTALVEPAEERQTVCKRAYPASK